MYRKTSQVLGRFLSSQKHISLMNNNEKQAYLRKLQQNSKVQYKQYPYLPHQDPSSQSYIHSELDEYHDQVQVKSYNEVIDQFKHDLSVQKQVWDAINNLDRPYKRGVPGVDTNLDPNGVAKPKLQDLGFPRLDKTDVPFTHANEDAFIANSPFNYNGLDFKHISEWENERRNRPATKTFSSKGYKYDVLVKPQDKYEYIADRLGHPEYLGTPMDRLLKLQNDIFHPTYLDQPFVKMPSTKPSQSLNFEQGQVIYENTRVLEWAKFWQTSAFVTGGFFALFVPFNLAFKTNLVTDTADEFVLTQYHLVSPATFDILRMSIPISAGAVAYTVYLLLNYTNNVARQYVVKMSYSKDKELVFVKRIDLHGVIYEEVYETAHLEIIPPSQKSGVGDLSSQDQDGLWRVTCMNTQKDFLLYNDPNHWNSDLRAEFIKNRLGMWDKSYYGFTRNEAAENERREREEYEATLNQQALPKY